MSSTDLIVPGTGELVSLDAPTDTLADAYDRVADLERQLRDARGALRGELLARMDRELVRKHQAGDFELECEAPDQRDYDPDELAPVLATLVADEKISQRAMDAALERAVSFKPRKRELAKLLASPQLTDADRAAVEACAHPRTRERRLTVRRREAQA